jgi:hypothetical protein
MFRDDCSSATTACLESYYLLKPIVMCPDILPYEANLRVSKQPIVVISPMAEFPYRCELYINVFHGYEYHVFKIDHLVFIGYGDDIERLQALAEEHINILNAGFHELLFGMFSSEVA